MPKMITEQNLRALIDLLIKEGARVVGPKQAGTMVLYEPLATGNELTLGTLPRRSTKEAFFPLSETILTFEKDKDGVRLADVDTNAFPETVLMRALPHRDPGERSVPHPAGGGRVPGGGRNRQRRKTPGRLPAALCGTGRR